MRILLIAKKFYIRRNNNKVNSIETGRIVVHPRTGPVSRVQLGIPRVELGIFPERSYYSGHVLIMHPIFSVRRFVSRLTVDSILHFCIQWNRFEINYERTTYSFQKRVFSNDLGIPSYYQIGLTFHFAYYHM